MKNQRAFILFLILFLSFTIYLYYQSKPNDETIVLGASLPLSGMNKELGSEVALGANIWFNYINSRGGINGQKIRFIAYDDKYEPQNTSHNLKKLLEKDKAFALFGFVGTPTIKKIYPSIVSNKIPLVASYTGAAFLRDEKEPYIVNFRTSYQSEIDAIVEHLYLNQNLTKFAIFYQNDVYGEEGYIATVNALEKRDLTLQGEGTYKRNTLSIHHALHEIASVNPEAIIIVGAYKPSALFIKQARKEGFKDVIFCPISFVNSDALVNELDGKTENILFSQTAPSYGNIENSAAKEYLNLLNDFKPNHPPTFASYETFLAAKAFTKALSLIQGRMTRAKLIDVLSSQRKVDLGGIDISFTPEHMHSKAYLFVNDSGFQAIHQREFK